MRQKHLQQELPKGFLRLKLVEVDGNQLLDCGLGGFRRPEVYIDPLEAQKQGNIWGMAEQNPVFNLFRNPSFMLCLCWFILPATTGAFVCFVEQPGFPSLQRKLSRPLEVS